LVRISLCGANSIVAGVTGAGLACFDQCH
jgi:hypothetical protein